MKVLLITDNHTRSGGAENYFFDLKAKLKETVGIEVYSMGFGNEAEEGEDYFVLKSAKSNISKLFWQLMFHPLVYLKLRKKIRAIQPDIIHLHNVKQYPISLFKAVASYPVVQTTHDFSAICPSAQNIHANGEVCASGFRAACFWRHCVKYNVVIYFLQICVFLRMRKQLKKIVKHFIAPSPLLRNYLAKNHFYDTHFLPPFMPKISAPQFSAINPMQFLFAGNLGMHKGIYLLVEEFALACRENNQLMLLIAGTGKEQAKLETQIALLGIEKNIRFLGWQKDLTEFYQTSIALIFPSTGMESFGMVITEAMSQARPVIGINHGTSSWLIDDKETGLLFNPHHKGDLAKQILLLADNSPLAIRLGQNGFEKFQAMFDNKEALEKVIDIYKSACGQLL